MSTCDDNFQFDLPDHLIAQEPPAHRGDSRLLLVSPDQGVTGERPFARLGDCLRSGDLLILNQSQVLPARLLTRRQDSGGQVELLLVRPQESGQWLALAKPARRLRPGLVLEVLPGPGQPESQTQAPCLSIVKKLDEGQVVVESADNLKSLAEKRGLMPLPPYIQQQLEGAGAPVQDERDRRRYQTVYAADDGSGAASVAAPTAGLHFSQPILDGLKAKGVGLAKVTLHVGPGTFRAPSNEQISSRRLHREYFHLPAEVYRAVSRTRARGGRVIAVGTTSLRVLETVHRLDLEQPGKNRRQFGLDPGDTDPIFYGKALRQGEDWEIFGDTRLFIRPPDKVVAADGLLTNFHLPGSSLLMLVASLLGTKTWPGVYRHAVQNNLRFYSYGDCMLILPGVGG